MPLEKLHINTLLDQCMANDKQAQLEVYNRYYKAMYNTSLRIIKDTAEAQDIMQESFLKAFTKLDSFKKEASFGSWLKRIVVNESISTYTKKIKRAEIGLDNQLYNIADEYEASHQTYKNVTANTVEEAMNLLKHNYRVSLSLHLIEGYDYEEISMITGWSNQNCRTLISRAKSSLREKLKTLGYGH